MDNMHSSYGLEVVKKHNLSPEFIEQKDIWHKNIYRIIYKYLDLNFEFLCGSQFIYNELYKYFTDEQKNNFVSLCLGCKTSINMKEE